LHLKSKTFQIKSSTSSSSSRVFSNNTKSMPKFHYIFFVFTQMNFQWKNYSIFNKFSIVCMFINIMNPIQCTPNNHQRLFNGIKSVAIGAMVWEISIWLTNKIQINYFLS
jgi:hypothetical protein